LKNDRQSYRNKYNKERFREFQVKYLETDLWIGIDPESFRKEIEYEALVAIEHLRHKLDAYIKTEPAFAKSLTPFYPGIAAPGEAKEMANASAKAGIGPMASVAGMFAREVGEAILQNFSVKEMVVENGGDIFSLLNNELVFSVYAGSSPLSEKLGIVLPSGMGKVGICTSAGTVGPSLSFGRADAVAVVCKDVLLADAFATALGNNVKVPEDIEGVLTFSEKYTEILSVVIVCGDKVGVRGELELKILK
jgi:ApbE superfamily uncharacterized protein (UPF0280 family)